MFRPGKGNGIIETEAGRRFNKEWKMRNRKCILAAVLALGLTFQAVPVSAEDTAQTEEETTEITIYHTNDTHGYLQGDGESVIGLPLVAGLKNADENAILVDAGDAT